MKSAVVLAVAVVLASAYLADAEIRCRCPIIHIDPCGEHILRRNEADGIWATAEATEASKAVPNKAAEMKGDVDPGSCGCPFFGHRVCGTDGNTYRNLCMLQCVRYREKPWLRVRHQGRCI